MSLYARVYPCTLGPVVYSGLYGNFKSEHSETIELTTKPTFYGALISVFASGLEFCDVRFL